MPKFQSSRLNGVAVIANTHTQTHKQTYTHTQTHTHILPNLGNTKKKNRGDLKFNETLHVRLYACT